VDPVLPSVYIDLLLKFERSHLVDFAFAVQSFVVSLPLPSAFGISSSSSATLRVYE
jgi:hypothetical protein